MLKGTRTNVEDMITTCKIFVFMEAIVASLATSILTQNNNPLTPGDN